MESVPAPPRRAERLPGELTRGWSTAFTIAWVLVAIAYAAVWVSARNTGLSTWWLGPDTDPQPVVLSVLPPAVAAGVAAHAANSGRWAPWFGIAGALALGGVAAGDLGRVDGYALVEFVVAGGALLVSVASLAGMLRRPAAGSVGRATDPSVAS